MIKMILHVLLMCPFNNNLNALSISIWVYSPPLKLQATFIIDSDTWPSTAWLKTCLSSEPLHALCHSSDPTLTTILYLPSAISSPHHLPPYRPVKFERSPGKQSICVVVSFPAVRIRTRVARQRSRRMTCTCADTLSSCMPRKRAPL